VGQTSFSIGMLLPVVTLAHVVEPNRHEHQITFFRWTLWCKLGYM